MLGMDRALPVISSATKAPPMAMGNAPRMVPGCMKSWNSSTSTP